MIQKKSPKNGLFYLPKYFYNDGNYKHCPAPIKNDPLLTKSFARKQHQW